MFVLVTLYGSWTPTLSSIQHILFTISGHPAINSEKNNYYKITISSPLKEASRIENSFLISHDLKRFSLTFRIIYSYIYRSLFLFQFHSKSHPLFRDVTAVPTRI